MSSFFACGKSLHFGEAVKSTLIVIQTQRTKFQTTNILEEEEKTANFNPFCSVQKWHLFRTFVWREIVRVGVFFFPSSFPLPRQDWEITYFIKWQHMLCLRREKCMFNPTFLKYKWWHTEQGDRMYEFKRGQIQRFTVLFLCCLVYIEEHHWIFELKVNLEVI